MGRARSSGSSRPSLLSRSAPAPAARPAAAPAAPAHQPAPAAHHPTAPAAPAAPMAPIQVQHSGPGFLGSIAQGFMMGTGSAMAHRAVDAVLGPRTVVHEHASAPSSAPAEAAAAAAPATVGASSVDSFGQCSSEKSQYQRCLQINNSDLDACRNYFDLLASCQRSL